MSLSDKFAIQDELMAVLDEETALAVMDHRRAKRAPLTKKAAQLLARQFAKCSSPIEAAEEMIMRGWTGFKPEWVRDRDMTGHRGTTPHGRRPNAIEAYRQMQDRNDEQASRASDHGNAQRLPADQPRLRSLVEDAVRSSRWDH